jgi:cytochrome P450
MSANVRENNAGALRNAPGPKGLPVLGSIVDMRREGVLTFYLDMWREYGDVVRVETGPMTMHQFVRPEHVQHILVKNPENYVKGFSHDKLRVPLGKGLFTSVGSLWRRQRRLMGPTYTPRGVTQFADVVVDATQKMLTRWQTEFDGRALAINTEMMRLTMSIISRSMFNLDVGEEYAEVGEAISFILEFANKRTLSLVDPPMSFPTPMNRRMKHAQETLDAFIYGIISERRRQPQRGDLLDTLMRARDEESGEVMSEQQLRDELLITFFAGHETTAQLLTWTWYLLAQHVDVEERFHGELDRVLAGRSPVQDDVDTLIYTRMLIDEVLRLYSPVAMVARDVVEDDEIDGYVIPAGSIVTITPYITHRHPEFWENPEVFDPEHFAPDRVEARPRYAYYPFGAGPRICLGKYFALQEAVLVLAEVGRRYQLRLVPGQQVAVEWAGTLRPAHDVMMTLEQRA